MRWFKHDSNAHRDAKLKRVKMKYGMTGYGLYWYCLEIIATGVDENKITFELEEDSEIIAYETDINRELVEEMMGYMISLELFESSGETITCMKLAKRLDQSMTSNPQMRKIIGNIRSNSNGVMTPSCSDHDGVMQDKIRSDKKTTKRFAAPSDSEVTARISEMGYQYSVAEDFCNFYGSKNWMVGKNKMADWHKALGGWESRKRSDAAKRGQPAGEVSYL